METPKKIPSISGNGNSKKLLLFQDMELLSSSSKYKKKIHPKKSSYILLYFGKWNFLTPILRNISYFLKRKIFSYFGKQKP